MCELEKLFSSQPRGVETNKQRPTMVSPPRLPPARLAALRAAYGEARVELWGPQLGKGRKYLGGAFTVDGTALLGVPAAAESVLRLDLETGSVTMLPGPRLPGKF